MRRGVALLVIEGCGADRVVAAFEFGPGTEGFGRMVEMALGWQSTVTPEVGAGGAMRGSRWHETGRAAMGQAGSTSPVGVKDAGALSASLDWGGALVVVAGGMPGTAGPGDAGVGSAVIWSLRLTLPVRVSTVRCTSTGMVGSSGGCGGGECFCSSRAPSGSRSSTKSAKLGTMHAVSSAWAAARGRA